MSGVFSIRLRSPLQSPRRYSGTSYPTALMMDASGGRRQSSVLSARRWQGTIIRIRSSRSICPPDRRTYVASRALNLHRLPGPAADGRPGDRERHGAHLPPRRLGRTFSNHSSQLGAPLRVASLRGAAHRNAPSPLLPGTARVGFPARRSAPHLSAPHVIASQRSAPRRPASQRSFPERVRL